MRVLVTGITGFVGSHLAEFLLTQGVEVHGTERAASKTENLAAIQKKIALHVCDITDAVAVRGVLEKVKPERIFHLAAHSSVPSSLKSPAEALITNIVGQLNIFEAVRQLGLDPLIHIAGSAEVYGNVPAHEVPIKETCPFRPISPYGVSKATQELLAFQHVQSYKMKVVCTRGFPHTGPRQREQFVASNFAKQIASIEAGVQEPVIFVGNLEPVKDFADVRDVVKAYWLALEKGIPGEVYNICTGGGHKIRDIVDIYLKHSKAKVQIKEDPARKRSNDVPVLVGDGSKFLKQTGWRPAIPFEQTLVDLLNYWRERIVDKETAAKN